MLVLCFHPIQERQWLTVINIQCTSVPQVLPHITHFKLMISLTFDDIRILNQAQLLVVENKKIYLVLDGSSWP